MTSVTQRLWLQLINVNYGTIYIYSTYLLLLPPLLLHQKFTLCGAGLTRSNCGNNKQKFKVSASSSSTGTSSNQ